ncbi:MAG: tRNA guanosine(34) transglycosylase Tgt [Candidatus Azosocius agrarius]|nr:MAG: tRNA guanosine(34) transglycosylase Tgt [Gammaproteobacteria bacterium]
MKYELKAVCGEARYGNLLFNNIIVKTPVFMPVGTYGVIKSIDFKEINNIGFDIILSNTFHVMLKPGINIINYNKGLHKFLNWKKCILTDSGGYQIFSLNNNILKNDGVKFKSYDNGKFIFITPEKSIILQNYFKSDIIMCLDDCAKYPSNYINNLQSINVSLNWSKRCKIVHKKSNALFGIIQGGNYNNYRLNSLKGLININFDGYALGGLSVGEQKKSMIKILNYIIKYIPKCKPRYLMGVGTPLDILDGVLRGIDMFDCVIPTRNARNGYLFTSEGIVRLKNYINKIRLDKIDKKCTCYTCNNFSISYLYHLNKCNEILGIKLNTIHNLFFYNNLMKNIQDSIINNTFNDFVIMFYNRYNIL